MMALLLRLDETGLASSKLSSFYLVSTPDIEGDERHLRDQGQSVQHKHLHSLGRGIELKMGSGSPNGQISGARHLEN
jgi:hypothetical protein